MMHGKQFIVLLVGFSLIAQVSAQVFSLANYTSGGPDDVYTVKSLTSSSDGYLYTSGTFSGTFVLQGDTVSTSYNNAVYLAKYDSDLSLIWLKKIAENRVSILLFKTWSVIAADSGGNVVVGLNFTDKLYFYGDSAGVMSEQAIEMMKLSPDGELIWSIPVEGERIGKRGLVVNDHDRIVLTGERSENILTSMYTADGDLLWERTAGGGNLDRGEFMAADNNGNLFVSGMLSPSSSIYFDSYYVPFPSSGVFNANFVAKYDTTGTIHWVRYVYSTTWLQFAVITAIVSDASGNIYCAGSYADSELYFSNGLSSVGPQGVGSNRAFLTVFDQDGGRPWVRIPPNTGSGSSGSVGLTRNGDTFYLLDGFQGTVNTELGMLSSYGNHDLVLGRFDSNGTLLSNTHIGGASRDVVLDMEVHNNALYLLGATSSHPLRIGADEFDPEFPASAYLVKLIPGPTSVIETEQGQRLAIYPNPNEGSFSLQMPPEDGEVLVSDMLGATLYRRALKGSALVQIELSQLSAGTYVVQFRSHGLQLVERIIVTQ